MWNTNSKLLVKNRCSPLQFRIVQQKPKHVQKNFSIYLSVRTFLIFFTLLSKTVYSPLQLAIGIPPQKYMKKHFSIYLSVSKVIHLLIINCSGDCSFSSLKQLFSSIKLMFFIIKNTKIRSPPILTTEKAYFLSKIM